jgi:hypothetical protein
VARAGRGVVAGVAAPHRCGSKLSPLSTAAAPRRWQRQQQTQQHNQNYQQKQQQQRIPLPDIYLPVSTCQSLVFNKSLRRMADHTSPPPSAAAAAAFVNHGLRRWEEDRQLWRSAAAAGAGEHTHRKAQTIDTNAILEVVFVGKCNGVLPKPMPLPQMVNLLVDLWESEGLFD